MNRLQDIEVTEVKRLTEDVEREIPNFKAGDTVRVHCKIKEGEKERIQIFEGVVIARKNGSIRSSFTVRKVSYGIGVERIFPLYAPFIQQIEVMRVGKVRRAKIYYLRNLSGKKARIAEIDTRTLKKNGKEEKVEKKASQEAKSAPEAKETPQAAAEENKETTQE